VVQHDDVIHVGVHHSMSALDRLSALEHDGAIPVCVQEREVLSRAEYARVELLQPPCPRRERLPCMLIACREACAGRILVEWECVAFCLCEAVIAVIAWTQGPMRQLTR
jgi:hypothetical protein